MTCLEQIQEIVSQVSGTPLAELTPDTTIESLGMDSIDMAEFIIELQEEFDHEFEDEHIDEFPKMTLAQLNVFIQQKIGGQ